MSPIRNSHPQYDILVQQEVKDDESDAALPPRRAISFLSPSQCVFFVCSALLSFFLGFAASTFRQSGCRNGVEIPWANDLMPQLSTTLTRFSGAFNFTNSYRGPPSPEIDAAWDRYDSFPILRVPKSVIQTSTLNEPGYIDTAIELEGGGYLATIEVFHQLHCLNMVRKATYPNYYKNKDHFGNQTHDIWRTHVDHCIEMIRQLIACNSDTGLVTYHWVKGNPTPYPDLNTWHQCRDIETVHNWAMQKWNENGIDPVEGVLKRPGVNELAYAP